MMQQDNLHNAGILIVDDQEQNVQLLKGILEEAGYTRLIGTTDSRTVSTLFGQVAPDLILLDLMMPYLDGYQIMAQLKPLIPEETYLPILVLTADITKEAKRQALAAGAKDFLTKPFDQMEVLLRIQNLLETRLLHVQLQNHNQLLEEKVRERTEELDEARLEILERLALAAEYRDDDTGQHTRRVADVSAQVARAMGLSEEQIDLIRRAASLHDVGKIGIPDAILLKPGKLTPAEFAVMRTHSHIGARILAGGHSALMIMAERIALTHHERWDGSGYPQGLTGTAIPLAGRIVALADVFDALTHARPYKSAWSVEEALAAIQSLSGRQFDPAVVVAFLRVCQEAARPPAPMWVTARPAMPAFARPEPRVLYVAARP